MNNALNMTREYYRNLVQQLANNCKTPNRDITDPDWLIYLPKERNNERLFKKDRNRKASKRKQVVPGVPHVRSSEIFEIGNVAGTANRSLELISAEWHNTKVALKRHVFPACRDAIKADIEVLSEIRHPNVLLLMATTYTDEHGIISIFEPVDCTLYSYIHDQGERLNIQGVIQIGIKLADALKYCHMRGYIHGAISSHCVYFASDRNVKLGGWELAREIANVYVERDYEKYLRLEIFKWQAPETFYGLHPSKKSDVYCFMLLLWEMCTGNVPWNGCDQPNEERHNSLRRRDISLNLQNIPSIPLTLRELLEIGLQSDEAKRTLDMDKISRKLHRLLMVHEEEGREATFISVHSNAVNNINNSNDSLYNDTFCGKTSSPSSPVRNRVNRKLLVDRTPAAEKSSNHCVSSKEVQCKLDARISTEKTKAPLLSIASPVKEGPSPCVRCSKITNLVENLDEKSDARTNLKRIKEVMAMQREDFFSGNKSSSHSREGPKATSTILENENNESNSDYVLCKPASHKTTMEPKCKKSVGNYGGIVNQKTQPVVRQKPPYTSMPEGIKQAIMQPQVLHRTAESFYESALWRKEKEICMSRMRRDSRENLSLSQQSNNSVSVTNNAHCSKPQSTTIDTTYNIIHDNDTEDTKTDKKIPSSNKVTFNSVPTSALTSSNKHIKNLEDALDRSTSLVRNIIQECEKEKQIFETLYGTQHEDEEIKVIEISTSDNETFLGMGESTESTTKESVSGSDDIFNQAFIASKTLSFTNSKPLPESSVLPSDRQPTSSQEMKDKIFSPNKKQQEQADFERDKRRRYTKIGGTKKNIATKDEIRRRSLPARLNNVPVLFNFENIDGNTTDGSQFTLKNNDGTCYIDDDYKRRSQLNCNLILFDDYDIDLSDTIGGDSEDLTTEL